MAGSVIGEAFVEVKPRTDNFGKDTEKGVSKGLGGVASKIAIGFGAVLATGAAARFVSGFVTAAAESQKISRVTDAILKSTGGAAGLAADQVSDLATRLSNLSGIDDELIQSSENILLTFTNIRDAAGAGNDIFSRTTEAALNMATVLGGDPTSSIQQLGKALNDPAEGLTKLTRSGVVFTDQQKEQVKALQASGDLLGAQKIILAELDKEFGGAAAAAADPFQRLKVATDNLKESIGGALIPVLAPAATALANLVNDHQAGIADGITAAFGALAGVVRFLTPGFQNLAAAFRLVFDQVEPLVTTIGAFVTDHLPKLSSALEANTPLVEGLSTAIAGLITAFGALVIASAVSAKLSIIGSTVGVVKELLIVFGAAAVPLTIAAAAIVAAAVAGELLFQKVQIVRDAFEALFGKTLAPFAAALTFLNPFVPLAVGAKFLYDNVQPVRAAVEGLIGVFSGLASTVSDLVSSLGLGDLFASISDTLGSIDLSGIADALAPALASIGGIAAGVGEAVSSGFGTAVSAIRDSIGPAVEFLIGVWEKYGDQVTGILVGFRDIAVAVFEKVRLVIDQAVRIVGVFLGQIANVADVISSSVAPAFHFLAATIAIAIAPLATIVGGALTAARIIFETFIAVIGPAWQTLWTFVSDVVSAVIGPISDIVEGFLTVIQGFVDIVAGIFTLDWERIWSGVGEIVSGAIEIVQGLLEEILGFLAAVWANAGALLTLPFTTAWTIIQSLVELGVLAVQTALQAAIDFVTTIWANIGTLLTAPVQIAYNIVSGLLNALLLLFTALPSQITEALSSFPTLLTDLGSKLIGGLKSGVDSAMVAVTAFFTGLGDAVAGFVGDIGEKLTSAGSAIINGFKTGVDTAFGAVIHFFTSLPEAVIGFVGDVGRKLYQKGVDIVEGFIAGIRSQAASVARAIADTVTFGATSSGTKGIVVPVDKPHGASGMVIPGQPGQPFPLVAHGAELLINPKQQANLLWNLANTPIRPAANGSPTFIDASINNYGTINGVDDFQSLLDRQADRLADIVASGRR